ncbi:MAG: FAD-dependent oxidoreductase [Thermodesulfobacteriota bacterium]
MISEIDTDILVVGGGVGALATALEASKYEVRVALVDKGRPGVSGSTPTSGGAAGIFVPPELGGDPRDSEDDYFKSIVQGGDYLNNQPLAEMLVREGKDRLLELCDIGVPYERYPDGKFRGRRVFGQNYLKVGVLRPCNPRWNNYGTGHQLTVPLVKEIACRGVKLFENIMVTRLVVGKGKIAGAIGIDVNKPELYSFRAKAVVLAAGSATGLYPSHSASYLTTGDAYALAYQAGAQLMNMEFQEFTIGPAPKGRPLPIGGIKPTIAHGGLLYDGQGQRFMERYDPERMEFARRSCLVQAVANENREGSGAFLDATRVKENSSMFISKLEHVAGFDWRKERIPLVTMIHTFLGGAKVDEYGETNVKGLFACGEAAGFAGLFGSDRVGTAISACLIFGQRAGKAAVSHCLSSRRTSRTLEKEEVGKEQARLRRIQHPGKKDEISLKKIARGLRQTAERGLGVIREEGALKKALAQFELLRASQIFASEAKTPQGLKKCLEIDNLALTGEMVARASLARQESRGQFQRKEFPHRDDEQWLKWIVIEKQPKIGLRLTSIPVPIADYKLKPL